MKGLLTFVSTTSTKIMIILVFVFCYYGSNYFIEDQEYKGLQVIEEIKRNNPNMFPAMQEKAKQLLREGKHLPETSDTTIKEIANYNDYSEALALLEESDNKEVKKLPSFSEYIETNIGPLNSPWTFLKFIFGIATLIRLVDLIIYLLCIILTHFEVIHFKKMVNLIFGENKPSTYHLFIWPFFVVISEIYICCHKSSGNYLIFLSFIGLLLISLFFTFLTIFRWLTR